VAADLTEDTSYMQSSTITDKSHSTTSESKILSASELGGSLKPAVAPNEASPDPSRPRIGKRKSFVGTVCELDSHRLFMVMNAVRSLVGWHRS